MQYNFERATKAKARTRARLTLIGPSGAGKTYTALQLATGLGKKIAVIDTEHGSAARYADEFDFHVLELEEFSPRTYVGAIHAAQEAGFEVLVIDSLSHAWIGKGGALDMVNKAEKRYHGNSFAAWREVTPHHNALVEALVRCKCHLITTMRSKTEYVIEENERGKKIPRKIGTAPIQRDGIEYEFDIVGEMDLDHNLLITKTRCKSLDGAVIHRPGAQLAEQIRRWLHGEPMSVNELLPAREVARRQEPQATAEEPQATAEAEAPQVEAEAPAKKEKKPKKAKATPKKAKKVKKAPEPEVEEEPEAAPVAQQEVTQAEEAQPEPEEAAQLEEAAPETAQVEPEVEEESEPEVAQIEEEPEPEVEEEPEPEVAQIEEEPEPEVEEEPEPEVEEEPEPEVEEEAPAPEVAQAEEDPEPEVEEEPEAEPEPEVAQVEEVPEPEVVQEEPEPEVVQEEAPAPAPAPRQVAKPRVVKAAPLQMEDDPRRWKTAAKRLKMTAIKLFNGDHGVVLEALKHMEGVSMSTQIHSVRLTEMADELEALAQEGEKAMDTQLAAWRRLVEEEAMAAAI